MSFTTFDLFSDVADQFINPDKLTGGLSDLSSAAAWGADKIFGVSSRDLSGGFLGRLIRNAFSGYGFIVDTVTGGRLVFQYNVNGKESGAAEYTQQMALGRSTPIYHYKGGQDRILEVPITFTMQEATRDDVRRAARFLQSLVYPDYNGDETSLAPHPIILIQGQLYSQDVWLARSYNIEWGEARDPITQLPSEATVNLTLVELALRGRSHNEILRL